MKSALPKVLQPIAGKPLLSYVVKAAQFLAPTAIHVVYGYGGEQVRAAMAGTGISSWLLQAEQLGTGHAMQQALPALSDDHLVLILYGDVPLVNPSTLQDLVAGADSKTLSLLTVMLPDATGYGRVIRDVRGKVQKIVEEKDTTVRQRKIKEANTGVMVLPVHLLRKWLGKLRNRNSQGEYYLTDVIAMAVKDKIKVEPFIAPSISEVRGINNKLQLAEVEAQYRAQCARDLMIAGVTLIDPARIDVRGTLHTGQDVVIDANVIFEGKVILGDRVHIGSSCILRDCEIAADVQINAHCILEDAIVGAGAIIGPFARLRPGARLSSQVHIGNFVEVKNSSMGIGAKANHLAYIGDATVGARVNIGAGTIIANYDGAKKHHTTLCDDAQTGSNSVLVAPLHIGKGATVAAGSTVTKDVPPSVLAVARAKQVNIDGWKRPKKRS